jgi:hypothetical protein
MRLTFATSRFTFVAGDMKSRLTAVLVCLLYLSVALVFGVLHHHHNDGPLGNHRDCAACAWTVNAVADAPQVARFVFGCALESPLQVFDSKPYLAPSFSFSPSRAPPITPA